MKNKYNKIIWISILCLVVFFAYMDTKGLTMVNSIGGYPGETYGKMHLDYMGLFWTFAYGMTIAVSLMFYMFRKDLSEAVSIFVGTILMLWGGLEDIVYYWMLGMPGLDQSMIWLYNSPLSFVSRLLGHDTVTPLGLYLQLVLMTFVTYHVIKWLSKQNKNLGIVKW